MNTTLTVVLLGSPMYEPPIAANMQFWYRSNSGITLATGVSQWNDLSGGGRHLTQATGSKQPAFQQSGGPNGLAAVVFDGSADEMAATVTLAQPTTIYALFRQVVWTSNATLMDGDPVNTIRVLQNGVSGASPDIALASGNAPAANNSNSAVGAWCAGAFLFNGASSSIRINRTAATTGDPGATTATTLNLAANGGGLGDFCNVAYAELLGYSAAHTAAQQSAMLDYLMKRGGI